MKELRGAVGRGEDRSPCPARSGVPATDLASHGCPTGSPYLDPCPQPDRSSADGRSELSAWVGEALRLSASCFIRLVLRQAVRGRVSARSGTVTRSGSRTDRCDDGEDPAVQPHHQAKPCQGATEGPIWGVRTGAASPINCVRVNCVRVLLPLFVTQRLPLASIARA